MLSDFFSLFYPNLCCGCQKSLMKSEVAICTECRYEFAYSKFQDLENNQVAKVFWGRMPVFQAHSLIEFGKGHRIQTVLHSLKYQGNTVAGVELGKMLGQSLIDMGAQIDVIVPVPLHPKRRKERGYNQSDYIAQGISEAIQKPIELKAIERIQYSSTQTNKGRMDRWDNVESIFKLKPNDLLLEQKVLLVDDVLTTGATMEACGQAILKGPCKSLSVATVACAL